MALLQGYDGHLKNQAMLIPHLTVGMSDPEYVMPSVMMKLFPPVLAALLITSAIAAMILTADSHLILSATEFII